MTAQVVHDNDVAGRECWHEELLDIVGEALAVDGLIEHARGINPVVAEGCEEGHRAPMAIRHFGLKPLTDGCPAPQGGHIRFRPRLINENKSGWIKPTLIFLPLRAPPSDGRPQLFSGQNAFF